MLREARLCNSYISIPPVVPPSPERSQGRTFLVLTCLVVEIQNYNERSYFCQNKYFLLEIAKLLNTKSILK